MRATGSFNERDLMRGGMNLVITIHRPVQHRFLMRLGFRIIAFGAWVAGFAGTRVETE